MARKLKKSVKRQLNKNATKKKTKPVEPVKAPTPETVRAGVLQSKLGFNEKDYEYDYSFKASDLKDINDIHTSAEMVAYLSRHPEVELEARILAVNESRRTRTTLSMDRKTFLETFRSDKATKIKMREDSFDQDVSSNGLVGQDFIPLLGGPFYKNLYYYQDYLRMHAQAFFAYHHDPVAKAVTDITTNFVMGKGFRVDSQDKKALAIWRACEQVNDLQAMMRSFCDELSIYGEDMIWKLPKNQTKIVYDLQKGEQVPRGLIPRYRLVDPSNITEIVTYPEDITRVLFYNWMTPTQYQNVVGSDTNASVQPTSKFIYQQIPAEQMLHYRINRVSNEKRGRSDYYNILGYMKRLRDAVNYGMISALKQSAWAIDTSIDGNASDIQMYMDAQKALGTIPMAGSEFVHTTKIKREFQSNQVGRSGQHEIFEWCWSMIASGSLIPIPYFGTHLNGGNTRATALVSTEPVAKKFETRQDIIKGVVRDLWKDCMKHFGIEADCEITFPEIITQDRSMKVKDLALGETQGWFSKKRTAETAAKEFGFSDYEYAEEQEQIMAEGPMAPPPMSPLSGPPKVGAPASGIPQPPVPGAVQPKKSLMSPPQPGAKSVAAPPKVTGPSDGIGGSPKPSAVTSDEKVKIKKNYAS